MTDDQIATVWHKEEIATAWHEAGHAVAAYVLGLPIYLVSINPADDGTAGRVYNHPGDGRVRLADPENGPPA